jgi:hypothetical protein
MRVIAVAAVIALAIGILIFTGVLSPNEVETAGRAALHDVKKVTEKATTGFSATKPTGLGAAEKCRATLKRIESAKRAVAQKQNKVTGTVEWSDVLSNMGLSEKPKCPSGGTYSLDALGRVAKCSVGGSKTTSDKDDHMIASF